MKRFTSIFYFVRKVFSKAEKCFPDIQQTIRRISTNLSLLMSELCSFLCLTVPRRYSFCGSFVLFMSCVCHAFASVHCCLVVTCCERADLLALVCDDYCILVTILYGILGQVWYLILSFPDLCHLSYFIH